MPDESESAASLCEAIVNGTFPQSEDLLTADLSSETIPLLLSQISETQNELSDEIKANGKDGAGDVDLWISQAKKVQEDIARCKLESKRIVEEHQHLQVLRDQAADFQNKVNLLETEIEFTERLQRELNYVALAAKSLQEVEECLSGNDPCGAATKLRDLDGKFSSEFKSRTSAILRDLKDELRLKTRVHLEAKLNLQIVVRREEQRGTIEVLPNELDDNTMNSETLLRSLTQLQDELEESLEPVTDKLKAFILQPLRQSARSKMVAYQLEPYSLTIELDNTAPSIDLVFRYVQDIIQFLQVSFAETIRIASAKAILPDLIALLVSDWLNPGLPIDLTMLDGLDEMEQQVSTILEKLKSVGWEGQTQLQDWMDNIHRAWLNKRKAATLDTVRKAFASSKGNLRQVERVERQVIPVAAEEQSRIEDDSNDWDANWDDDPKDKPATLETAGRDEEKEDDASGWGFEDEDNDNQETSDEKNGSSAQDEGDDAGDAWGWGDDSPVDKRSESVVKEPSRQSNGAKGSERVEEEVTLTEVYSISEIPDHLIEVIGRDLSDSQTIEENPHKSLDSSSASRGLFALPTLALAMYRATAPSYYGASPALTDIHRYNDSSYIAERLRDMNVPNGMSNVDTDIKAMEKFAKMAYSKEMETQRIIVWDLLEGAQGFTSCTQFPYSQEIESAVSSVVDRIRTLQAEWKPILSTSALMQSIGSLVTMVITKVISSIEEMDDISEPESRRLTAFCQQIAALEDLFLTTPPSGHGEQEGEQEHEPVPMTAVYVANWLRFQYLINILESSLVDIKYLWTEGELSLEFSENEVVDLIKALFAESAHRRSAIAAIKGSRSSR